MKRRDLSGIGNSRIVTDQRSRSKRRRPFLEALEQRTVMTAIPVASLNLPAQALIGETLNFTVGFSDASPTSAGYGPYVDLFLPTTGKDGAKSAPDDGISFASATYLGAAVTSTVLTFDAAGNATHPYAKDSTGRPVVVVGTPGDELVVLQLPFGSFTPGQPTATVNVTTNLSNLADVGSPLSISARGGFQYGNDALDDPTTDPTIIGGTTISSVDPSLMLLKTTYLGPEDETATGPDFPRQYLLSLEVANGQTLTNLDLTDALPSNLQFVSVDATTVRGVSTSTTAQSTPSTTTPGGTITRRFASVTGSGAANDATLLFTFYAPRLDAGSNPVIDPSTGLATTSIDDAKAQGNWTPIDPRDPSIVAVSDVTPDDHTLNDRSLATQETVTDANDVGAPGPSPGDTLQYTIQFQVSDYFALQNLVLSDLISDGQHFDSSFTPTLQVNGNAFILIPAGFGTANYTVSQRFTGAVASTPVFVIDPAAPDGTSTVNFRVSDQMVASGENGQLVGGLVPSGEGAIEPAPGNGPTTATIVFRTVIQQAFTNNFPSGEANLDDGDRLDSGVTVSGTVLNNADLSATANTVTDTSGAKVNIVTGNLTHSIYAINGDTSFTSPALIAAGDSVTYRVTYTLPTNDEEQLSLSDFVPLPIFDATTVTNFDDVGASGGTTTIPAIGHANFGPGDTFRPLSGVVPTLSSPASTNSLLFSYVPYKDPANGSSTIDLLFTVQASSQPFADGLFLTSQAHVVEGSTNAGLNLQDQIVQLKLTEPVLKITKGIIATDDAHAVLAPGIVGPVSFAGPGTSGFRGSATISSQSLAAHPINSNVSKVDAGDLVTFAVLVENTGSGLNGAFNVQVRDTLPAGFVIPEGGLNLSVTDGAGTAYAVTTIGTGLFDPAGGLELADSGTTGAVAPYSATSGRNLVVITYDLLTNGAVSPNQTLTNRATLTNYASTEGGPDFTTGLSNTATARISNPGITKTLTSSDQSFTTGSNLAIGEVGTYTVVLTIPEGVTSAAKLIDTLPAGLAIVGLDSVTATSDLSTSNLGSFANASVSPSGSSATFDFGTLTNSDRDNSVADTITVVYRAVALNVASNNNGAIDDNSAIFSFTGGSVQAVSPITIVTPLLQVVKTVDKPTADAGDTVTYTLVISHAAGSGVDAFNVNLSDVLPAGLTYVSASLVNSAGVAPASLTESGGTIAAAFTSFPLTSTSTITFQATVGNVAAFQTLTNTANVDYTSLPATGSPTASPFNALSTERTGNTSDPGGSSNNLDAGGTAVVTVPTPPLSKIILGTSQAFTAGNNVAIGEEIHYQLTVTVPEGTTPNASLVDDLPAGMAIVSVDSIQTSGALSTSVAGGFAAVLSGATIGLGGASASFDFETLTDADRNNATNETIVITYTVVVLNSPGNVSGTALTNSVTFATPLGTTSTSAPAVTVVEPVLQVSKTPSATTGDAGGAVVTFTIVVSHALASNTDAFDVNLTDPIPSGFTFVAGSLLSSAGLAPDSLTVSNGTISASYAGFTLGTTSTIQFQATLNATTSPGQAVTNTASLTYASLPGNVTTAESTYNPLSTERTGNPGDPGGATNTYDASGSGTVTVNSNSIGGFAYVDANDNGGMNTGETAIPNVTVALAGTDNLGNVVSLTTSTDATGAYDFTGLRPGNYSISEAQPAGYLEGTDALGTPFGGSAATQDVFSGLTIPLGTNAAGANYLFGELRPASINGFVFSDANDDGAEQVGELGIPGVSVTLSGTDDLGQSVSTTATTDGTGAFNFTNLRPGNYSVGEVQPAAYLDGQDSAGNSGGTLSNDLVSNFPLVEGQVASAISFGELAPASLAGSVYLDANDDGSQQAGEPGIDGVPVILSGTDDLGNSVSMVAVTSNGQYDFANLRPGNYAITKIAPAVYLDGQDTAGTEGGFTTIQNVISGIALSAGVNGTANSFGELLPSSLAGFVYADANDDGVKQGGESGIGGVLIALSGIDDRGAIVGQYASTAADGSYGFSGLRPGTYAIAESPPSPYLDGQVAAGTQGGATAVNLISTISLGEGVDGTDNNFGEITPSSLSGVVYFDSNDDGTMQLNEPGISGQTVTLTGTDDLGNDVSLSTATLADGTYSFANLRPGTYNLGESGVDAFLDGTDSVGTLGGSRSTDNFAAIAVGVGVNGTAYDFAELAPAGLSGSVYADSNDDGVPQAGEPGIASVSIGLRGMDDMGHLVTLSTTTAANGSYAFPSLRPGTYTITEVQPAAYLNGKDTLGSLGGTVGGDAFSAVHLLPGSTGSAYNFGELVPASLAGNVYADVNDDGTKQAGEPGIAGAHVILSGTDDQGNGILFSSATAANGSYAFANLRPGVYVITETRPPGYLDGEDAAGTQGASSATNDRIAGISLMPGITGTSNNFGNLVPASLAGTVYVDANNDGLPQAGEPGIAGVVVALSGTDDHGNGVNLAVTTAFDGSYQFAKLRPGTYAIAEARPASYLDGKDALGSQGGTLTNDLVSAIAVASGTIGTGNDFGELAPASLSGEVYSDVNDDGVPQSAESGIGGAVVILSGTDDLGNSVTQVTSTLPTGTYSFTELRPGTYAITEAQPAGFLDGEDAAGSLGGTLSNDFVSSVLVHSGDDGTDYNFGELDPASLAGFVYDDVNLSGAREPGEPGINGAVVLLSGTDDLGNPVNIATATGSDGTYAFTNLRPGSYALIEVQPDGYLNGTDTIGTQGGSTATINVLSSIVISAGEAGAGNDFGELQPSSLAGSVYDDANNDGTRQVGEPGIAGVAVNLSGIDDQGNEVNLATTTAVDGSYVFVNLQPGTYAVAEVQPAAYLDGRDQLGSLGGSATNDLFSTVVVGQGVSGVGYDFGELAPGSLSGSVFVDANDNAVRDVGEIGIADVSLTLSGLDDLGHAVNATATTGDDGSYSFAGLRPGLYAVAETQPTGYLDGKDAVGASGGILSNDRVDSIPLTPETNSPGYTFGELVPAALSGVVFEDPNDDGLQQEGEPGIAGASVALSGTDDLGHRVAISIATAADGTYAFNNLRPGSYSLVETRPVGYLDGTDVQGAPGNGVGGTDMFIGLTLGSGVLGTNNDFANLKPSTLSGSVYVDANDDGVKQIAESGVAGVSIALSGIDDLGDTVTATTLTAMDGSYAFVNLRPGTYAVAETQPASYLDGKDSLGSLGGTPSNDDASSIAVGENAAGIGYDFGELAGAGLAGIVYADSNDDGVKQVAETGVAGVTITLFGIDDLGDVVTATTQTAIDGSYAFVNLRPGAYAVAETQPGGYLDGTDAVGNLGGTLANDFLSQVVIGSGSTASGYDFGELPPSSLSGSVFVDTNDDGQREAGEAGIAGVTITLSGIDDLGAAVHATATTAADGSYQFANVRPGTYALSEAQPPGFLDGNDAVGSQGGTLGNDLLSAIALSSGTAGTGNTFGELIPSSLGGLVYVDANDDGIVNADEPGIAGVGITLSGHDDRGQAVSVAAATAADGSFAFTQLRPGLYTIAEAQPAGYLNGKNALGTIGGTLSNDVVSGLALPSATSAVAYRFGELLPASVTATVFDDHDNDGLDDNQESGIAGVAVTLEGVDDLGHSITVSANTGSDGKATFGGLRPGLYSLAEAQPAAYLDGKDSAGTTGGALTNDHVSGFRLTSGTTAGGVTFGELDPASLAGSVYADLNDNGVRELGEIGIAGVAITLTGTDDLGNSVVLNTSTAADGSYAFAGLRPGSYTVTETQPVGYLNGQDALGTAGGTLGDDATSHVTLSPANAATGYDFGELPPASLAGVVYGDVDNDGIKEPGEAGIGGVTITLTGTDDLGNTVNQAVTTGRDGTYAVANLRPGIYALTETRPPGYLDGKDSVGTQGGTLGNDVFSNIVLAARVDGVANNFGELVQAGLAGVVFRDDNNDGIQDPTEPGIAGVTLTLTGTDDLSHAVVLATTSGVDGSFGFAGLRPGTYSVAETQPPAYFDGKDSAGDTAGILTNDTVSAITLTNSRVDQGVSFGELLASSLSGTVFADANDDGIQGKADLGIAGVALTLAGTDDLGHAVNSTLATAADGTFTFPNLRPGTYSLAETQPSAYLSGIDSVGTQGGVLGNDLISGIILRSNTQGTSNNFAELTPASLAGSVFLDANDDGIFDVHEAGIAAVTVTLTGVDDHGQPVSSSLSTNADGSYRFSNLRPGVYVIAEALPTGDLDGKDTIGTSGGVLGNGGISNVILAAGINSTANNLGQLQPGSIAGSVFDDLNNDGVRDSAELGIAGARITLTGTDDLAEAVSLVATTAADGTYSFSGLRPGLYAVAETQPASFADGRDSAGNSGGTLSNDLVSNVPVASGTNVAGVTFGEVTLSSLAGFIYVDANDDGAKEPTEPGLAGVTVTLSGTDDLGNAVGVETISAADGSYAFGNLRPGTYVVAETPPSIYLQGAVSAGTAGGIVGNARVTNILLSTATAGTAYNFAELDPSSVSGSVYVDANQDGVRNQGEPPIAGVMVTLTGTDDLGDPVNLHTTTAPDGAYLFAGLRPGLYQVAEAQPVAYSQGTNAVGSAGGIIVGDAIIKVALGGGATASGYTFGEQGTTLAGMVFFDASGDGKADPGDPGMGGVGITLFDSAGNIVATTTSSPNGAYEFENLPAGAYTIQETKPGTLNGTTPTTLSVTLPVSGLSAQDFGLATGSLSGSVYLDSNDDGIRSGKEAGIANVVVTLTGTDLAGDPVSRTTTTGSDGTYRFDGVLAGTYSLSETQPASVFDGRTTAGNLGGKVADRVISGIVLSPGGIGSGNDFAGLTPSSLSGFAYLDLHRDGMFDAGDVGIAHVTITLSGTDDLGNTATLTTTSQDDGSYKFDDLRPGHYVITDLQPKTFKDAVDNAGSQGGTPSHGAITNVVVGSGVAGTNNNFGELPKPNCKLQIFVPYGANSVAYLNYRRGLDPSRFDHYHSQLGPFLARGGNPAARVRFSAGPAIRHYLPTLGKPIATVGTAAVPAHSGRPMDRLMHRSGPKP